MPTFATPDPNAPTLSKPETPEAADARFHRPDVAADVAEPDAVPAPVLKKPDDGLVVEFPMPGAAGMSMIGMVMGPRPAVALMLIAVVGPPTAIANVGNAEHEARDNDGTDVRLGMDVKAKREGFEADDGDSEIVHHEVGETAGDRYVDWDIDVRAPESPE